MDRDRYCREIEAYLCRKNDGHLVRIVGPSFELVSAWAEQGVPLKVAFRGIDRHFERYYAKGPRRRPVRIDFCEADVLDVFDEWRRAIGLRTVDEPDARTPRRPSLAEHLERVIARLTARRAQAPGPLEAALEEAVRALDAERGAAKTVRGEARAALLARLEALDRALLEAARASADAAVMSAVEREVDDELAAFRSRMNDEVYARTRSAACERALRERLGLPTLTF
jgi:hypothetical protein